jgi:hypothetical protein
MDEDGNSLGLILTWYAKIISMDWGKLGKNLRQKVNVPAEIQTEHLQNKT